LSAKVPFALGFEKQIETLRLQKKIPSAQIFASLPLAAIFRTQLSCGFISFSAPAARAASSEREMFKKN
jgi:hypothetical protein